MPIRQPIEYDITPKNIDVGTRWLALSLRNIGTEELIRLDVRLNSLDAYSISVYGTGSSISSLRPNEEQMLSFQVLANSTGSLYVTLDGWRYEQPFHWESPGMLMRVGKARAELTSLFALTEPYPRQGEAITCEATLRGLAASEGLALEFWAASPSGEFENLAIINTEMLSAGEEVRYRAEMTPVEEGLYTIYTYLYDEGRRVGYQVEHVYVK
jgi:hypothetical protein